MNRDAALVKDYVTANDHLQYTWLAEGTVQVNVTHSNLRQFVQELRLDLHSSIADTKQKLYTHNGSNIDMMELQLKDKNGNIISRMIDDNRPLGYYGVTNGMTIHVVDNDPFSLSRDGGLDDVSRIEKYRMTEEEYDKREKSYRAWKKNMVAKDPNWKPPHLAKQAQEQAENNEQYLSPDCVSHVEVGKRCSIFPGDRRGEVMFIGTVTGLGAGYWVGIKLDEPLGKNNGTYNGVHYFEAQPNYGSFVRPSRITVGDFPSILDEELDALCGPPTTTTTDENCCADHSSSSSSSSSSCSSSSNNNVAAAPKTTATTKKVPKRRGEDSDDDNDDEL